ncbi:NAD(P)/FAD-dependent oxidoreductase [Halorussus marinus]|uniref:NAD(P)/FAD-dependent oxidoreductase n=1 Tax=Halorussus marinus TaxID=2505976 RepID=UPI00143DC7F6|nr:FAD-dependent oxidoreductase [Halorussus marinus]
MSTRYSIIGGGIVGASIAYHLSKRTNEDIVLFERQSPASETTYKSVAQYGFYGDETQYRMKKYGMRLYNEFFDDPRANPRYHYAGLLVAATEQADAEQLEAVVETEGEESIGKIGKGFDRDLLEYLPGDEIEDTLLLPPVETDAIEGALYRPKVGYMSRPQELAYEFLERAKENGATIRQGTPVKEITTKNGRVTGVVTEDGEAIESEEVICAAGPWNIELAESVGVEIPVKHTIAPVLQLRPQKPIEYDIPIVSHYGSPYSFHRRSEEELLIGYNPGYEAATRFDPNTMSETVPEEIRDEGIQLLSELIPGWLDADVVEQWVGVRSQTPDGNPIVGWTELEGFSIAAFHTSGIQLAPAVGKMITSQLLDNEPTSYYDALSIKRFDGYDDHHPE